MITLEAVRIGNLRLRLVEMPSHDPELIASRHYIISEHVTCRAMAAIVEVGYSPVHASKALTYFAQREQARVAADEDDGL